MSKHKILIVDDEVMLTKMLKLNLDETGQYETKVTNNAKEALSTVKEYMPDLVLLDVMMPEMQGNEIAEQFSEDNELKNIKIVFLTALVKKSEISEENNMIGGRKFIAKPVKIDELIAVLEQELA